MTTVRGLLLACHPLPCAAVTAFAAAYAVAIGLAPGRVALLAAAVLAGQLSIGWCNDAVDAGRDRAADRRDKPVAVGLVGPAAVWTAAGVAVPVCLLLSFALGIVPGAVHTVCVAAAWAYDLGLKRTVLSPAPYLLAFGLLPGVASWSRADGAWPPPAVTVAAALLGLGAHFANTVGDTAADAVTGVRGLPQRLGPTASLVVTAVAVGVAAVVLGAGTAHRTPPVVGLLGLGALLAAGGAAGAARAGRVAFRLTLVAVALVVAGFVTGA